MCNECLSIIWYVSIYPGLAIRYCHEDRGLQVAEAPRDLASCSQMSARHVSHMKLCAGLLDG